jgi:cytochrome c oxidase subunit 4
LAREESRAREREGRVSHRGFLVVFAALMLFAGLSFSLSFVDLGAMTVPAAMIISLIKALLIAIFFMELIDQRFVNRFVLVAAAAFVVLLISLMVTDVLTRGTPPLLPPE